MTQDTCLNCDKELIDAYCSGCGQKADTHRISFKNFIFHDVLHGTFHIERGMLFTAKEALTRPGKAALDYIAGKRKRYYNVFYLILITFGLILFFIHVYETLDVMIGKEVAPEREYLNEASRKLDVIISQNKKFIIFLFVPLSALNSFIVFRRRKLNLSEHFILSGMILLGMLLLSLLSNLFFNLELIVPFNSVFSVVMSWLFTTIITLHIVYGYVNAFGSDYSRIGIAYRIGLFFILLFVEVYLLFFIVVGVLTNWKFGTVSVSPFG